MPTDIRTALSRFKLCSEAFDKQVQRETRALEFQVPENHWPKDWQDARKGGIVDGVPVPAQPMLSIPKLDQTYQMLDNQCRAAHLGVTVSALSEDAEDETAEVIQGLYRRIEVDSRAHLARLWGYQRAYKAGRGAYKVDKVWDTETGTEGDQKIVIKRLLFQSSAYFDPFAQEPDFSDMRYAFEVADLPFDTYVEKYGKVRDEDGTERQTKLAAMDDTELTTLARDQPDWVTMAGAGRTVRVAGYWRVQLTKSARGPDTRQVFYSLINGVEEIERETEWDGHWIPLIPVIGRELIPFDGERHWVGVTEPAMDGQRLFNVAASNVVEKVLSDTKPPWIMYEGQDEGHEREWQLSGSRRLATLKHRPVIGPDGAVLPPPQKNIMGVNIQGDLDLLQIAGGFIQDATTTVDQSRIEALAKKKVAHQTLAGLQESGDAGRSDFLYNLADISMTYEAKVVIDLIPFVYDRPGRIARILGREDKSKTVMLNAPFVMGENGRPQAVQNGQAPPQQPGKPPAPVKHYDLKTGVYGVLVTIGKGFPGKNAAQSDQYAQLFQADPAVIGPFLPFWMKANSFPVEAIERAEKMVPPQLRDDPQDDPKALQAQIGQMKQAMDQLQQQLQQAGQIIQSKAVEQKAKVDVARLQGLESITIQRMKDATSIAVAQINASTKIQVMESEATNEAIALGNEHAHAAHQAKHDRAHELAMAVHQHGQAMDAAVAQHEQGLSAAEQEHQQALEQGAAATQGQSDLAAQGHEQSMEQQQQAAELAPPPAEDGGE